MGETTGPRKHKNVETGQNYTLTRKICARHLPSGSATGYEKGSDETCLHQNV